MFKDYFIYSLKNLRHRKLRSWLTIIGIIIGISAVVSLISLGNGLQNAISSQFNSLGTDKITVTASFAGYGPPGSGAVVPLTQHDTDLIEKIPGVKLTVNRIIRQADVFFNDQHELVFLASVPDEKEKIDLLKEALNLKIDSGKFLEKKDNEVVVGNKYEKNLFDTPLKVGDVINIAGKDFKIKGILRPTGNPAFDKVIFMNENVMRDLLDIPEDIDIIVVQIDPTASINDISNQIEKVLRKDRNEKIGEEDFEVSTPQQALDTANTILMVVQFIVVGIAAISLIVGGVGVMNTMYTAVLERTNEIGVMKAIGAKNSDILLIFLIESSLIGLIGGIIGVLLGISFAKSTQILTQKVLGVALIQTHFSFWLIFGALLFSVFVGTLAGITPARQAAKMKPVDSLRYE